jgi:hypothetical protein
VRGEQPLPPPSCTVTVSEENEEDNALQTAINANPGGTICVGSGVFPEQLTISTPGTTIAGNGNTSTIIEPSAPLTTNTFDYDSSSVYADLTPAVAIILVQNTTDVTLEDLQVSGANAVNTFSGCGVDYFGIDYQNSSGTVNSSTVTNIELPPADFGCQAGTGIYAYNGYFLTNSAPSPAVAVTLSNSTVTAYDKNGITCDDLGETCTITDNTVVGIGATPLTAQNGIQVAYGADASVVANTVTGNHYTGNPGTDMDYFTAGYDASGILVYDAGSVLTVEGNTLSGNDLSIPIIETAAATVSDNDITQGYAYGISLDLNASLAYVGLPVYGTEPTWASVADDNNIANVNVGVLVYDDNVTISGGTMTNVNVSVESVYDYSGASYSLAVDDVAATANVSAALLGNISSFQSTGGTIALPVGAYTVSGDVFQAGAVAYANGGAQDGIAINGTSASIGSVTVSGFDLGIYISPTVGTASILESSVDLTSSVGAPGLGIWAGNAVSANPDAADTTGQYTIESNLVTGPGGGAYTSPMAGSVGIQTAGAVLSVLSNTVIGFSDAAGQSPSETGYNWYQGSQSVALMVACSPGAGEGACTVSDNVLSDNVIGVVNQLWNSAFSGVYQTGPMTISDNTITDSLGYGVFQEWTNDALQSGPVTISDNTIDNSASGAIGMVLGGATFAVDGNILIGSSDSGTQGASESGWVGGPLPTASIAGVTGDEATTDAVLNGNVYLDTTLTTAYLGAAGSTFSSGEPVTFTESGLPGGTTWSVTAAGTTGTSLGTYGTAQNTIAFQFQNSSYSFSVAAVSGYEVVPSTGPGYSLTPTGGTVSVSGTEVSVPVAFAPALAATLQPAMTTIAIGGSVVFTVGTSGGVAPVTWTLEASGSPANLTGDTFSPAQVGVYTVYLNVTDADGADAQATSTVTVTGIVVTFTERGLTGRQPWAVTFQGATHTGAPGASIVIPVSDENGQYGYLVRGPSGWRVNTPVGAVGLPGTTSVAVTFSRGATYNLHFVETGAASGSPWCVTIVNSADHLAAPFCSTTGSLLIRNVTLTTTYDYAIDSLGSATSLVKVAHVGWVVQSTGSFAPSPPAPRAVSIRFAYPVTFTESGLTGSYSWFVSSQGIKVTSSTDHITLYLTNGSAVYSVQHEVGYRTAYPSTPHRLTIAGMPQSVAITYTPR